jgi:hypothetical protein
LKKFEKQRAAVQKRITQMKAKANQVFGNMRHFVSGIEQQAMSMLRSCGFLKAYDIEIEPAAIDLRILRRFLEKVNKENHLFAVKAASGRTRIRSKRLNKAEVFQPIPCESTAMPHVPSFHGTPSYNYDSILQNGLLPPGQGGVRMANGRCYGSGIYSAANPTTSIHYTRNCHKMFICGLLTNVPGTTTHGHIYVSTERELICPLLVMHFKLASGLGRYWRSGNSVWVAAYIAHLTNI